jgi:hypothetical protein
VCGGQGFVLESLEEACMRLSPRRRVGWVASPGLGGRQVAVLRLPAAVSLPRNLCHVISAMRLREPINTQRAGLFRGFGIQHPANKLRRIRLPRIPVNKGEQKDRKV